MVRNMTGFRELARNHDFTVLWVAETISELGSRMSLFVFPLLAYHLTGSTVAAAVAEAAYLSGWSGPCCRPACWPTGSTGGGCSAGPAPRASCSTPPSWSPPCSTH